MFTTMRSILSFFILFTFAFMAMPALAQESHLPIVFEDYPPYEYVEDGEVKGINMDIIREAFRRMGVTPYFEPRPWKRAVYELKSGEILALSSGFKTAKREEFAVFPSEPLAMETNVVAALTVSGVEVNSLEDLRGLRVGVVREYSYGESFDSMRGLNKIKANSSHQMLKMLLSQRMDVAVGNKAVFKFLAKKQGMLAHIKFIHVVGNDPLYLMFSKKRGARAQRLARDFSIVVREMHKDGTFKAIQDKY